jgi:uncharacterized membrane protein
MSTTRQITLTETPDGRWTAYDTATHAVTQGPTRDAALEKLDEAVGQPSDRAESGDQPPEIDPDDPLFTAGPLFASEDPLDEDDIDDVLYDEVES